MVDEEHIRHCMLYELHLERKASEAEENNCSAFGQDAAGTRNCQQWFEKFCEGNFSLDNEVKLLKLYWCKILKLPSESLQQL